MGKNINLRNCVLDHRGPGPFLRGQRLNFTLLEQMHTMKLNQYKQTV
jgi:hypothetical protein